MCDYNFSGVNARADSISTTSRPVASLAPSLEAANVSRVIEL